MNAFMLFTGSGAMVILTSHAAIDEPTLLEKLAAKGVDKFLAYRVPIALAQKRYGMHFDIVARSLAETDDLRVLDFDGSHAVRRFGFGEMSGPVAYEATTPAGAAAFATA
jgi:hypothetical protein